jgi:putative transposase
MDDVRAWQARPLDDVYPVVFLDAFIVKIRENGSVQRKACYLALGVRLDGERDVLGMWFQDAEGAKFWMHVLSDLKRRGVRDILICCVDGLTGFPEAIEAGFPLTTVQTCVVHLIRRSLRYVPRRKLEKVAKDLKPIYTASDNDTAWAALEVFEEKWGQRFPPVVQAWQDAWEHFTPFLRFTDEVRRVVYTTKAIEALNRQLRKAIKTKEHFPSENAARKLIYLAIHNAAPQWTLSRTGFAGDSVKPGLAHTPHRKARMPPTASTPLDRHPVTSNHTIPSTSRAAPAREHPANSIVRSATQPCASFPLGTGPRPAYVSKSCTIRSSR